MDKTIEKLCANAQAAYAIDGALYTKYNVKKGLRNSDGTGVLVGLTHIGDVHGYKWDEGDKLPDHGVLRYRGIDVAKLVEACEKEERFGFEEAAYLLMLGQLPTKEELADFSALLGSYRGLPAGFTEDMILKAPSPNIMNKLARAVLASYSYDNDAEDLSLENVIRQSIELISRFPAMVAYAYQAKRRYYDDASLFLHSPKAEYSTAENFLHLIRANNEFTPLEAEVLDIALILHAEHGGGNNSSFTAHVVSSSGTDTYSAIAAAVGSLKGPKHGGANNRVCAMMEDLKQNVKNTKDKDEVKDYLVKALKGDAFDHSGLVYGMGHAIYTLSDPRAVILKRKALELATEKGKTDEFELYSLIEELTPELFAEIKRSEKSLCANVDLYSGLLYSMLDIPPELFTPIFAIARVPGWCAHRIEEITAGKRIIRPAYKNIERKRDYVNITER